MATEPTDTGFYTLLRFSVVADRGKRALTHFLDNKGPLHQRDLSAIQNATDFLDFTLKAQALATGQTMQGFSPDKMQVREAVYEAASARSTSARVDFEFNTFLSHIKDVLSKVRERTSVDRREVSDARLFLSSVRDHFQLRVSGPIETVCHPDQREVAGQ